MSEGKEPRESTSKLAAVLGATVISDLNVSLANQGDVTLVSLTGSADISILQRNLADGSVDFISEGLQFPQDDIKSAAERALRNCVNQAFSAEWLRLNPRPILTRSSRVQAAEQEAAAAKAEAAASALRLQQQSELIAELEAKIASLAGGKGKPKLHAVS